MASGIEKQCQVIPHSIRHHLFGGCLSVLVSRSLSASLSPHPHFFSLEQIRFSFSVWVEEKAIQKIATEQRTLSLHPLILAISKESQLCLLLLYIKPQGKTLSGWDTCSSKTGPYDCLLNGHFPLLPHKHNSDPITVPDDYVLWKVESCGFFQSSKR